VQILLVPMASFCAHVPPPKSQDSDLHRPMAWFPGAYALRALSWAHVRVCGAAWCSCHTPAWPGSAHFVRSSYVNRALFGISTSAGSVLKQQSGFLWRVRVPQGPATSRNNHIGLSVVQVRMAGPGCLTDGCAPMSIHKSRLFRDRRILSLPRTQFSKVGFLLSSKVTKNQF
jgi:hypothetical protein